MALDKDIFKDLSTTGHFDGQTSDPLVAFNKVVRDIPAMANNEGLDAAIKYIVAAYYCDVFWDSMPVEKRQAVDVAIQAVKTHVLELTARSSASSPSLVLHKQLVNYANY